MDSVYKARSKWLKLRQVKVAKTVFKQFIFEQIFFFLFNLQLTFGSQAVSRDWLVAPVVIVTNKFGEVMQNLIDAGHDGASTGVVGEFVNMTLCIKRAGRHKALNFRQ